MGTYSASVSKVTESRAFLVKLLIGPTFDVFIDSSRLHSSAPKSTTFVEALWRRREHVPGADNPRSSNCQGTRTLAVCRSVHGIVGGQPPSGTQAPTSREKYAETMMCCPTVSDGKLDRAVGLAMSHANSGRAAACRAAPLDPSARPAALLRDLAARAGCRSR